MKQNDFKNNIVKLFHISNGIENFSFFSSQVTFEDTLIVSNNVDSLMITIMKKSLMLANKFCWNESI